MGAGIPATGERNAWGRLAGAMSMALRVAGVVSVLAVLWILGATQMTRKVSIIKPVQFIGHSDEAGYALGGVGLAEGRGLTVPYVSYFFRAYEPWGRQFGEGGAGVHRREDHWPPFMNFAIAPCVYFLGKEPWVCKLPATFFGSIGLPLTTALLTYALCRRGYAALVAGLIMMMNPLIYTESLKTLSDISTAMLVTGFAGSVVLAQRHPWMHIVAGAFLAGAYFAKGSQIILLGLYPLMALLCEGPTFIVRKSFWSGIATALFLMTPYWYGNWKTYGYALHSTQNYVSGFYAVDNDWETRAYYSYWGKDLPRTSDLWTPLPARKPGENRSRAVAAREGYAEQYWPLTTSRRMEYTSEALGVSEESQWREFGPLGVWWHQVLSRVPRGPTTGPYAVKGVPKGPPFSLPAIGPLFSRQTLDIPLLVTRVNIPVVSDFLRQWRVQSTKPTPAGLSLRQNTPAPPRDIPVAQWPFKQLAGLAAIIGLSLAVVCYPVVLIGARVRRIVTWLRPGRRNGGRVTAPAIERPRAWFPGPVIAVSVLLASQIAFIAFLWAVWEARFLMSVYPLVMGLGCAMAARLLEWPIYLAAMALRGILTLVLFKLQRGQRILGWLRQTWTVVGHWHIAATLIVAAGFLINQPLVSARIQRSANPGNGQGSFPFSDDTGYANYPGIGKWVGKNLPDAVIMCRNPWELLFYCGPNNRGIGLVNPDEGGPAGAEKILAICKYYHVTHMLADSIRPAMAEYLSTNRQAFRAVRGAPATIYEIDWSKITVRDVGHVFGTDGTPVAR